VRTYLSGGKEGGREGGRKGGGRGIGRSDGKRTFAWLCYTNVLIIDQRPQQLGREGPT